MDYQAILLIAVGVAAGTIGDTSACDLDQLYGCLALLHHTHSKANEMVPYFDQDSLNMVCSAYANFSACWGAVEPSCADTPDAKLYQGRLGAIEFLCGAGLQVYEDSRTCFARLAGDDLGRVCNHTYNANVLALHGRQDTLREKKKLLCRYMFDFVACIEYGVSHQCGAAAGTWIRSYNMATIAPSLKEIGCQAANRRLTALALLGITVAASFLVMTSTIGVVLWRRRVVQRYNDAAKFSAWWRSNSAPSTWTKSSGEARSQSKKPLIKEHQPLQRARLQPRSAIVHGDTASISHIHPERRPNKGREGEDCNSCSVIEQIGQEEPGPVKLQQSV